MFFPFSGECDFVAVAVEEYGIEQRIGRKLLAYLVVVVAREEEQPVTAHLSLLDKLRLVLAQGAVHVVAHRVGREVSLENERGLGYGLTVDKQEVAGAANGVAGQTYAAGHGHLVAGTLRLV